MPANNDPVSQWLDQSGNGYHLVSPTTQLADRPIFKDNGTDNVNGLPVVRVAAGQGMDLPPGTISPTWTGTGLTILALLKYTIEQSDQGPFFITFEAGNGHQIRCFLDVNADLFDTGDPPTASVGWESTTDGFNQIYGLAAAVSGTQVLAWVFDSAAGTGKIYRNGTLLALTRDDGIYTEDLMLGSELIELFNQDGAGTVTVGDFLEVVGIGRALDATEVAAYSAYLKTRGGIS